jgi:SAM-dependent methyltransferase
MTGQVQCRSCAGSSLIDVLDLGCMPLANALLTTEQLSEPEETYPLKLVFCPHCSLVQITETVLPGKLFREYAYFSSFSDAWVRHARKLVERLVRSRSLGAANLAVEIASNDGYLLQHYGEAGVPVLGIEPAENIANAAKARGVRTITDFFTHDLACRLVARGERADVIHANNVLAHVGDLNGFVKGCRLLLKDDGVAVIEVPYVKDLIDGCQFDTIYHEHLSYFSLTALKALFARHAMVIRDVERLATHGGSLRLFIETRGKEDHSVTDLLQEEAGWGVQDLAFYGGFGQRIDELKQSLRGLLLDLKSKGQRLAAYGAAAKGSILLNYFQIGRELLDFVVDRSTYKQGRYMPGVRLPICPPERLLEEMPGCVLLLTWNFADEVIAQQAEYRRRGGRFIIPIPQVNIA